MNATDLHLVDLNNDGDLDLVVASNGEPLRVLTNDGVGRFSLQGEYVLNNNGYTYKVAIGDANGDGRPDVYMANSGLNANLQGEDQLLLGDGAGGLVNATASALPGLQDDSIGATFVDVDNDGDQDVVVANFAEPSVLLLNNGAGTFTDASARLPAQINGATAVAAADVDGDGYADLLVGNEATNAAGLANSLWLNDGAGSFNDASVALPQSADATFNVRLVDVDADGDVDALIANLRGLQQLWLNNGGVFTDVTATNYPATNTSSDSFGLALGDFNNDRALDVIYVRRGLQPLLLLNTPR
jgi:hypothetical protein